MRYETYLNKMRKHDAAFNKIFMRMLKDTNAYAESNPTKTGYGMNSDSNNPLDVAEHLIFSGVWIIDRIEGNVNSNKSLKKKVRKILGYSYP